MLITNVHRKNRIQDPERTQGSTRTQDPMRTQDSMRTQDLMRTQGPNEDLEFFDDPGKTQELVN